MIRLSRALGAAILAGTFLGSGCVGKSPRLRFAADPPGWTHEDEATGGRPTYVLPPGWSAREDPVVAVAAGDQGPYPLKLFIATRPDEPNLVYINMTAPDSPVGWKLFRPNASEPAAAPGSNEVARLSESGGAGACDSRSEGSASEALPTRRVGLPGSMPPSVLLSIRDIAEPTSGYRAQGLWLGDFVLTVLHPLAHDDVPPREIGINSRFVDSTMETSGNTVLLKASDAIRTSMLFFEGLREDWALLRVSERSPFTHEMIEIGNGAVVPGETLYMVGYDTKVAGGGVISRPLRVPRDHEVLVVTPPGTYALVDVDERPGEGWSGGFVGRHREYDGRWDFIGLVVGGTYTDQRHYAFVIRPSDPVLVQFFGIPTNDARQP